MDLLNQIAMLNKQLTTSVKMLRQTGTEYAKSERDYKIALKKKALELRDEQMPVTLIQTVIYGYDEIAQLRFKRDCTKVVYEANLESINSIKLQLRLLDSQVSREWGNDLNG